MRDMFEPAAQTLPTPCAQYRRTWTPQEDATVKALVQQFGTRSWTQVAPYLEGRTAKQARRAARAAARRCAA